jgi:hypothetical protein
MRRSEIAYAASGVRSGWVSHLSSRFRRAELDLAAEQQIARIAPENGAQASRRPAGPASAADRWTLRGIPAVGGRDSAGSAIPGTQPEEEALRRLEAAGW